jgi:anaerobic selenocysteine-containing dehydrogenase
MATEVNHEQKHVMCRACHAHCGLIVDFENGVPVKTHGDKNNPEFEGYSCIKGRQLANYHSFDSRLLTSYKGMKHGQKEAISWRTAAQEIAERIEAIVAEHGPDSVASYVGTFGYNNLNGHAFMLALMDAIGSTSVYDSVTIDQPGKGIARALVGPWLAGAPRVGDWDGLMLVGTNPVVSMNGGLGMNPAKKLHDAKKRGMQLIAIDPRVTDSAKQADLHLQCRPGEDPIILAAIAKVVIDEGLYDQQFVANDVEGFDALKKATAPFTPDLAAQRADVSAEDIVKAARMYGSWKKGSISVGTGPNMSGGGNITEYLNLSLTSIMGHWLREGDINRRSGVFMKPAPPVAASPGPMQAWGFGRKLHSRDLEQSISGMPTAALPDEILTPGDKQVKALICLGGNPMLAWPDQLKTFEAMKSLDLLVCLDPRMSKTAELADYVIAPKLHYEVHGNTAAPELYGGFGAGWGFENNYAQASLPIMDSPEGSDLCEEYEFLHTLASEMGKPLKIKSFALVSHLEEREAKATTFEPGETPDPITAWSAALNGSPVAVADVYADPEAQKGKIIDAQALLVQPKPADWEGRLSVGNAAMMEELSEYAERLGQPVEEDEFPFRMIGRRMTAIHNSNWHEDPVQRKRVPHHPAFMNPADMEMLGLTEDQPVEVESARAFISCVAKVDKTVRAGCVSLPHSWGTNPDEKEDPLGAGGNTGRLSFNDRDFDKRTGIPLMSSIPIRVRAKQADVLEAAE